MHAQIVRGHSVQGIGYEADKSRLAWTNSHLTVLSTLTITLVIPRRKEGSVFEAVIWVKLSIFRVW